MSQLVIVLGMHRSGTSFLTHTLHQAGMHVGTDLMDDAAASNLGGHLEAWDSVRINDRVLQLSGGAWNRVPRDLRCDEETETSMSAFVASFPPEVIGGWKDPRTTLTFPLWKKHLRRYRIAAALRHPCGVARSLELRDGMPFEEGLQLWRAYNERLLRYAQEEEHFYWFDYDLPERALLANCRQLCRRLGLWFTAPAADLFNPMLRHHTASEQSGLKEVDELYRMLRERAREQRRAWKQEASRLTDRDKVRASAQHRPGTIRQDERAQTSLHRPLSRLADIHQAQNSVLQEFQRTLHRSFEEQRMVRQEQAAVRQEFAGMWQEARQEWIKAQAEFIGVQGTLSELTTKFGELSAKQQAVWKNLYQMQDQLTELCNAASAIYAQQTTQESHLRTCEQFVLRIRNSFLFRLRRAIAALPAQCRARARRISSAVRASLISSAAGRIIQRKRGASQPTS